MLSVWVPAPKVTKVTEGAAASAGLWKDSPATILRRIQALLLYALLRRI